MSQSETVRNKLKSLFMRTHIFQKRRGPGYANFGVRHSLRSSQVVYIIGAASVVSVFALWFYSVCSLLNASTLAKISLANAIAAGSLALAGIILVLLGLALGLRNPAEFDHKLYTRSLAMFFVLIPLSLISSFSALIFGLDGQDSFLLLSLSTLFLTGILLLIGTTVLVAKQL